MRRAAGLASLAILAFAGPQGAADGAPDTEGARVLQAAGKVEALRLVDVDGDGLKDVVALTGRRISIFRAARGALPAAAPSAEVALPPEATFVDVDRVARPALVCLTDRAGLRLRLDGTQPPVPEVLDCAGLGWRDGERAVFADLFAGPEAAPWPLLPAEGGWRLGPPSGALQVEDRLEVAPPGAFLGDACEVRWGRPRVFTAFGPPGSARGGGAQPIPEVWVMAGDELRLHMGVGGFPPEPLARADLSFLPASGERLLLDLDGDGTPDLVHRDGDNREGRYAFFRVPPPEVAARPGGSPPLLLPDLRPPAAFLRLSGFNLEPDYVDVDGDGRIDLVVTTIPIDLPNTVRAVSSGKVTATTLCFRQRAPGSGEPPFPTRPDASVTSDVGVKIRFGAGGNIDVRRSFTILSTADLDGDGRRDLVLRTGADTLLARRGAAEGVWSPEARAVPIPALGPGDELEAAPADLDGAPGDELVLLYRSPGSRPDRLVVLRPPR